jgi:hypothetical protein
MAKVIDGGPEFDAAPVWAAAAAVAEALPGGVDGSTLEISTPVVLAVCWSWSSASAKAGLSGSSAS